MKGNYFLFEVPFVPSMKRYN